MRKIGLHAAAARVALALVAGSASAAEDSWSKSFETAMASAKASNKFIMADFDTDW